jgi:hypothetical protein
VGCIGCDVSTWIGIDFSGNHLMWRPRCRRSNVWIARVNDASGRYKLQDLRQVQDISGDTPPFERLAALLSVGDFAAAGIDAPFALPVQYMPTSHSQLLNAVAEIPCGPRPFPSADNFVTALAPDLGARGQKVYRETEAYWRKVSVNTRSTVWAGARGGAPMTASCLKLLHAANRPIWPWSTTGPGLLVEAFPAAQLKTWGFPHQKYNGTGVVPETNRRAIVAGLAERVELGDYRSQVLANADALDAVVAAFAAVAVRCDRLVNQPKPPSDLEGWIAVHE